MTPEDVFAGRARPNVKQLIQLLRDVNPVGDEPDADERYAVKSRLQSILIERYSDELDFREEPDMPHVVLLRHRFGEGGALHTVVDNLTPDARAWITRIRDERAFDPDSQDHVPAVDDHHEANEVEALIARGHVALREYDYEAAEQAYRAAFSQADGAEYAAVPLLEFLVEHLANYPAALALSVNQDSERVRRLLALAAVRSNDIARALSWTEGLSGPEVAEVRVRAAAQAMAQADELSANRHLEALRHVDPTHPEILRLEDELSALRIRDLGPEEARLSDALATDENESTLEAEARRVLKRWPESQVARRVITTLTERQRDRAVRALITEADAAHRAQDLDAEILALERILEQDPHLAEIKQRLQNTRQRLEQVRQDAVIEDVLDSLTEGDRARGRLRYTELDEPHRTLIRELVEDPVLPWLEALDLRSKSRRDTAVRAVLALEQARTHLARGDHQDAAKIIAPHREVLLTFDEGRNTFETLRAREDAVRQKQAEQGLFELRAALERNDVAKAQHIADEVELSRLPEAGPVLKQLAELRTQQKLEHDLELALNHEQWIEARALLDRWLPHATASDNFERWQQELPKVRAHIRTQWEFECVDASLEDGRPRLFADLTNPTPGRHLTESGDKMIVAQALGKWVFLQEFDVHSGRVLRSVSFCAPDNVSDHIQPHSARWLVGPSHIWLSVSKARWLSIDLEHLEPTAYLRFDDLLPDTTAAVDHMTTVNGNYCWFSIAPYMHFTPTQTVVIDIKRRKSIRTPIPVSLVGEVGEPHDVRVLCRRDEAELELHSLHRRVESITDPTGTVLNLAVNGADGPRALLINTAETQDAPGQLRVKVVWPTGLERQTDLGGFDPESPSTLVWSEGQVFVRFASLTNDQSQDWLVSLKPKDDALVVHYRLEVPHDAAFVQNAKGTIACLYYHSYSRAHLARLSTVPPQITTRHSLLSSGSSFNLMPVFRCETPLSEEQEKLRSKYARTSPQELLDKLEQSRSYLERLIPLLHVLQLLPEDSKRVVEVLSTLVGVKSREFRLSMQLADIATKCEAWDLVLGFLKPIESKAEDTSVPVELRAHMCHLLALSYTMVTQTTSARRILEIGLQLPGRHACNLNACLQLTRPFEDVNVADVEASEPENELFQVITAVAECDRRVRASDHAGALAAIDRPAVWRAQEIQSMARLAVGFANAEVWSPSVSRFQQRLALTSYDDVKNRKAPQKSVRELPQPTLRWPRKLLKDVERKVSKILELSIDEMEDAPTPRDRATFLAQARDELTREYGNAKHTQGLIERSLKHLEHELDKADLLPK